MDIVFGKRRFAWRVVAALVVMADAVAWSAPWPAVDPLRMAAAGPVERVEASSAHSDQVAVARKSVDEAKQAQEAGREPLPGERQRLANGHSRLRPSYFERQRKLANDVREAEQNLRVALKGS